MQKDYNRRNRRKYSLKAHIVLVTKYRKILFSSDISNCLKTICRQTAIKYQWNILAIEADKDHIHLLLEYDTTMPVCDIVARLKQTTTYYMWQKYGHILKRHYYKKHILWSDGYFVCSIGEASTETIQKYIESQG